MGVAGQSRVNTSRIVLATLFVGGYGATAVIEIKYEDIQTDSGRDDAQ